MRMNTSSSALLLLVLASASGCSAAATDERTDRAGISSQALMTEGDAPRGAAALPPLTTLAARRAQITFPAYTPDQRQLVAEQAQILLRDLYVHRYEKIAYYGDDVDPVPRVAEVVANARTMNDADFHLTLQNIFSSTRDLHTNYYFPNPYACNESFLPFDFAELRSHEGPKLVVAQTYPRLASLEPALASLQIGDRLVSYNGQSAEDALDALVVEGSGANVDGGRRRAMQAMTYLYHLLQPIPAEDSVHLVLRHTDGTEYAVDMPWLSYSWCAPSQTASAAVASRPVAGDAVDVYQQAFQKRADLAARTIGALALKPSNEPILSYGTVSQDGKDYGYLYLTSFEPQVLSVSGTVDEIARLLKGELAGTAGLIIDVRDNGGGYINLADEMLQLFSPRHVDTIQFRLKNSALNAFMFDTWADPTDPFTALIDSARKTNRRYTGTAPITDDQSANHLSQAYFAPVAVLTNSACYSSCDMFTAGMQDNGLATIWGEDHRTGAGGANVVALSEFTQSFAPGVGPFRALPGAQDMRVAWRDAIRAGKNEGRVLEDYGVSADRSAARTLDDVLHAGATQIHRIASDLSRKAGEHTSRVSFSDGGAYLVIATGQPIALAANLVATTEVEFLLDGVSIGKQSIDADGSVTLSPVGYAAKGVGVHRLEIRGTNGCDAAWRAFRIVSITP